MSYLACALAGFKSVMLTPQFLQTLIAVKLFEQSFQFLYNSVVAEQGAFFMQ